MPNPTLPSNAADRPTKTLTLRLPDDLADDLALVARLEGVSGATLSRTALTVHTRTRLAEPAAQARLTALHTAERDRLRQLHDDASTDTPPPGGGA